MGNPECNDLEKNQQKSQKRTYRPSLGISGVGTGPVALLLRSAKSGLDGGEVGL